MDIELGPEIPGAVELFAEKINESELWGEEQEDGELDSEADPSLEASEGEKVVTRHWLP